MRRSLFWVALFGVVGCGSPDGNSTSTATTGGDGSTSSGTGGTSSSGTTSGGATSGGTSGGTTSGGTSGGTTSGGTSGGTTSGGTSGGTTSSGTTSSGNTSGGTTGGSTGGPISWPSIPVAPFQGGAYEDAFAFDASGQPHVVYTDATDKVLRHAWRDAGGWHYELIDGNFQFGVSEARMPLAAFGSDGTLHVTYVANDPVHYKNTLRYASHDSSWHLSSAPAWVSLPQALITVGNTPYVGRFDGNFMSGQYKVILSHLDSGSWVDQTVESFSGSLGGNEEIKLWTDGSKIWLAYSKSSQGDVYVAEPTTSGWGVNKTPLNVSYASQWITVAPDGTVHLVGNNGGVTHVFGSGAFWTSETITGLASNLRMALALDAGNPLVVSVKDNGASVHPRYTIQSAKKTTSWTVSTLDSVDYDPSFAGLTPALSPYFTAPLPPNAQGLVYKQLGSPVENVDLKLQVGKRPSVAVGADGTRHVAVYQTSPVDGKGQLFLATESAGKWSLGDPIVTGLANDPLAQIAIGSDGHIRVLYFPGSTPQLGILNGTFTSETIPATIDSANVAMALDGSNQPHLAFVGSSKVQYGLKTSTWSFSDVSTDFYASSPLPEITVDGAGHPYIGYRRGSLGEYIQFARQNNGVWQVAQLAYDGNFELFAMAIDASGRPCVAHAGGGIPAGIDVECLDGGSFATEHVTDYPGTLIGMGRDMAGHLQILSTIYDGGTTPMNTLMWYTQAATWSKSAIGALPIPAFAVSPTGDPAMIYYDVYQLRLESIER
jgi:hypothetical protein